MSVTWLPKIETLPAESGPTQYVATVDGGFNDDSSRAVGPGRSDVANPHTTLAAAMAFLETHLERLWKEQAKRVPGGSQEILFGSSGKYYDVESAVKAIKERALAEDSSSPDFWK